jgi:hypothetical protein
MLIFNSIYDFRQHLLNSGTQGGGKVVLVWAVLRSVVSGIPYSLRSR